MNARDWARRPTGQRWLLMIAAAIFAALAVASIRSLPDNVELQPLFMVAIALIAAPATVLLNALEYRAMAKAVGHRVGLGSAARVSVLASLANYLPAPGGVAVRTAALTDRGSSLGSALSINAIAGVIWIGVTSVLVGVALLTDPELTRWGVVAIAVGAAILVVSAVAFRKRALSRKGVFTELLMVEVGTTLIVAVRVALSLAAIGQPVSIAATFTIGAAPVIAAAIGIFPAGLGLREAVAAGLATAVSVPSSVAVAASAVERVSALAGMVLCAPLLGISLGNLTRSKAAPERSQIPPA